jgi:hypothetical protein
MEIYSGQTSQFHVKGIKVNAILCNLSGGRNASGLQVVVEDP